MNPRRHPPPQPDNWGNKGVHLYDPALGSVQTIDAAHGLLCFDIDNRHIAWAGGPGLNELYLYDLASGETTKVVQDSQQNGESIVVRSNILTWTGRVGGPHGFDDATMHLLSCSPPRCSHP